MSNLPFMNKYTAAERQHRLLESMLLEQLEAVEACLTAAEKMRELVPKGQAELDLIEAEARTDLDSPTKKHAAQRKLRAITTQRKKYETDLRRAEQMLRNSWQTTRTNMHRYLSQKKGLSDSMTAYIHQQVEAQDAEEANAGGGMGLMGQLGMALFALKTSNAFDDLAKLSGRK